MQYIARYEITTTLKQKILASVESMISKDGYYAYHGTYGVGTWDADGVFHKLTSSPYSPRWGRQYEVKHCETVFDELSQFKPDWDWFEKVGGVGWMTCAGNVCHLSPMTGNQVVLTLDGRRHGIKRYFHFFREYTPSNVLSYQTERPDASPFDSGLSPPWEVTPESWEFDQELLSPPTIGEEIECKF